MDPVSISIGLFLAALGGAALHRYRRVKRERLEAALVVQAMQEQMDNAVNAANVMVAVTARIQEQYKSSYADEPCDTEMQKACLAVLRRNFPNGIERMFDTMVSVEDRREFVRGLVKELAGALKVELYEVDFSKGEEYKGGYYRYKDTDTGRIAKSIWLNDIYLVAEPEMTIRTLLHELRHAVQAETIHEADRWGVSAQRRKEWMYSDSLYVNCTAVYCLQPIEIDANVFSDRIMNLFNGIKKK